MINPNQIVKKLLKRINRLRPRRFQSYCVGAAKTGTTSIASSFSAAYRARHEPEAQKTNRLVIDYLEGNLDRQELHNKLVERDRRLKLEMESAHPLGYVAGVLSDIFPDALFIVTIREPLSWLRSRLNYHHKVDPPSWQEYRQYFWTRRHQGFAPEEAPLQSFGLCSLDTYLSQYADHYRRVLNEVSVERRLLVRTSEINQNIDNICTFVGAHPNNVSQSHSKRSDNKIKPLDKIDETFVNDRIMHHCGNLVERYFPHRVDYYTKGAA